MESYRSGEIVLLEFPFTDAAGMRRRPALVMLDTGDDDIVVARVTTGSARDEFDVEAREWSSAGLLLPSIVRIHNVATIEKRLVERRLGMSSGLDLTRVREATRRLWNLS